MELNDYQRRSRSTAKYPNPAECPACFGWTKTPNELYPALGLGGEAGEVLEVVKKVWRDNQGEFTPETRHKLKLELGDVLWYLAAIASEQNISLQEIAEANLEKLKSRLDRGVISGSGDER